MSDTSGQAYALMVVTPVADGQEQALRDHLAGLPTGADSPLAGLGTTHFARFLVLHDLVPQATDARPDHLASPHLLFTSSFDGALRPYLDALRVHLREHVDAVWGRCVGFPGSGDADAFARYLLHNQVHTTFFFSAYPRTTVPEVLRSLALREQVTALAIATQGLPPAQLRRAYDDAFGSRR
jgi:hypothetical protein